MLLFFGEDADDFLGDGGSGGAEFSEGINGLGERDLTPFLVVFPFVFWFRGGGLNFFRVAPDKVVSLRGESVNLGVLR